MTRSSSTSRRRLSASAYTIGTNRNQQWSGGRDLETFEHDLLRKIAEALMLSGAGAEQVRAAFSRAASITQHRKPRPSMQAAPQEWWVYGRVLSVWHQSPEFTDQSGKMRPLPYSGAKASFQTLVARAWPRTSAARILKALISLGAVRRSRNGTVTPVSRTLIVKNRTQMTLLRNLEALNAIVSTMHFNAVQSRARRPGHGLYERAALCERFDMRHLRALDSLIRVHGQALLEFVDNWLSQHEVATRKDVTNMGHVGVGVYVFAKKMRPGWLEEVRTGRPLPSRRR